MALLARWVFAASPMLLLAALSHCSAEEADVAVVLEGLDRPTDVILVTETGALLIAEAGRGRVVGWRAGGVPEPRHEGFDISARLLLAGAGGDPRPPLLVVANQVTLLRHGSPERLTLRELNPPNEPVPYRAIAASESYLFALRGGQLLRSRRSGNRFTTLRPHGEQDLPFATALCFGEGGHLIVAHEASENQPAQLTFHDPHTAGTPSVIGIEGVESIYDIGLGPRPRPTERRLYLLAQGEAGEGLYRLDAQPPGSGGRLTCKARPIARISQPTVFTPSSDGGIYVVVAEEGKLLQVSGNL